MSGSRRLAALARLSNATNAADLRSSSEPSPLSSEPSPVSEPSSSSSSFTPGILNVAIGSMAVGSPAASLVVWLLSASFVWPSSASSASSSTSFLRPSSRNTIDAASCRIRCGSAYCAHPARSRPGRNNALSVTGIHHSRHLLSATPPPSRMQTSSRPRPRPLSVSPFFPLPLPMTHRSDGVWLGVPGSIPRFADSRSSLSISQRSAALSSLISVPAAQHTLSSRMASRDSSRRFGRISRSLRAPIFGTSAARGTYRPLLCAPRSMS